MRANRVFKMRSIIFAAWVISLAAAPLHLGAQERRTADLNSRPAGTAGVDGPAAGIIPAGSVLTVNDCVTIALSRNPDIMAATGSVEVSRSLVGQFRSAYYPQIDARASYSKSRSSVPTVGEPETLSNGSFESDRYTGSVVLTQNIFDFGRRSSSIDAAKSNLASSRSDLVTVENLVALRVKQAYYRVLQATRDRDVALDVLRQFELHLEQAKGFYDVGTRARIDVIKAEVDLSNARLALINAENELKIARVNLNIVMGVPDPPAYSLEDDLSFEPYQITLDEATAKAFENRPDLKAVMDRKRAAESNVDFARAGYYPFLSGNATYSKSGDNMTNVRLSDGWQVGAALTFPLFNGFLTSQQVAEAKSNVYIFKANEEALRQQILLEVREAFLNLQAAEAGISTAELAVRQAKENLDLANGRYEAGVGSPVEVSDAFATYVSAQANYTSTLANYKIAQAAIVNAMGVR